METEQVTNGNVYHVDKGATERQYVGVNTPRDPPSEVIHYFHRGNTLLSMLGRPK